MVLGCLTLAGCGDNLFSLEDEPSVDYNSALDDAETDEEVSDVISDASSSIDGASDEELDDLRDLADSVIDDPDSSTENVQDALILKGEVILEQQGIESSEILVELIPLIEASDDDSSDIDLDDVNIFDLLDVSEFDEDELAIAADAFNSADDEELLAALLFRSISAVSNGELSEEDQYYRGLCNMLMVMKVIDLVYEVDMSGEEIILEAKDNSITNQDRLNIVMDPTQHEDVSGDMYESIDYYAEQASDGLEESNTFDEDVLDSIQLIVDATAEIASLHEATQGESDHSSGVYTYEIDTDGGSNVYDFTPGDSDQINSDIESALTDIFESINI